MARNDSAPHETKESSLQVSIQEWMLYILRSILVVDLSDDWSAFGCHAAQLSHLAFALHIATAENATVAIMYDSEGRTHIRRLSRIRGGETDFVRFPTDGDAEIKQRIKSDCVGTMRKFPIQGRQGR